MRIGWMSRWTVLLAILCLALAAGSARALTPDQGYLGVELEEDAGGKDGAYIHDVEKGSPAARAGLSKGQRIVEFDGKKIANSNGLIEILKKSSAGDSIRLGVLNKDGWLKYFEVKLAGKKVEVPVVTRPYLGVRIEGTERGVRIEEVLPGTPAAKAGLKAGDLIVRANGKPVSGDEDFNRVMSKLSAGNRLDLQVLRRTPIRVTLGARELEPATPAGENEEKEGKEERRETPKEPKRGWLGVRLEPIDGGGGLKIIAVIPDSPAEEAGLKANDILIRMGDRKITGFDSLGVVLDKHHSGDTVGLLIKREGLKKELEITLGDPQ
jgi:S1-C subfamily serine protease